MDNEIKKEVKNNEIKKNFIILLLVIFLSISLAVDFQGDKNNSNEISKLQDLDKTLALTSYNAQKTTLPPHDMYCIPERKISCSINNCENIEARVFVLISENNNKVTISRCDDKPCDIYEATPYFSGAFMEIRTNDNHGLLFKTSSIDQSFVEVVTLGTDTLTSYGHCYKK